MKQTRTYDSKKVLISLGPHTVTGLADDSFLSIEPNGDGVSKKVGCDGEIVRSLDPDTSAKVSLTVLYGSSTAAFCQKQYKKDYDTGEGIFPLLIKDLKGGLLFSAPEAWVIKMYNREFGKESNNCEIEIDTGAATWDEEGA